MAASLYKRTGIYAIRNKITGKAYIGQTAMNFGDRRDSQYSLLRHNKHTNLELQKEFNSFGIDNYEFIIVEELFDCSDIDEREKFWISEYKKKGLAYNLQSGGKGFCGLHISEHAKKIIGEKNRQHLLGHKQSEATKAKRSATLKSLGFKMSEEHKEKLRRLNLGKKASEETKHKLSITHAGEKSSLSKYKKEQILEVRSLYDKGCRDYDYISKVTGVNKSYISAVIKRERWKYI